MGADNDTQGRVVGSNSLLGERILELERQHGTLRAAARVLQCDPAYLYRLKVGDKDAPNDALLRKMGLRRLVIYQRLTPNAKFKGGPGERSEG